MRNLNKTEEYACAVLDGIQALFRDEDNDGNPNYHLELENIDATKFFTGALMGLKMFYDRVTGDDRDFLEFTHLCNTLAVGYLLENAKVVTEEDGETNA